MILENYTPELFIENYIKDCEVFGEETTEAIYEEIFSAIYGKKVKLGNLVEEIIFTNAVNNILKETPANDRAILDYAAKAVESNYMSKNQELTRFGNWITSLNNDSAKRNGKALLKTIVNGSEEEAAKVTGQIADNLAKGQAANQLANIGSQAAKTGLFSKIVGFITSLPGKVKTFFGGLKGKSFSEIMKRGMSWLQANPALALKTTGGIALVALLIRALKKRGELSKYKRLQGIYDRTQALKEDCYDTILEDTDEKKAMREILEECKTNKKLENAIFGSSEKEIKKNYFIY